MSIVIADKIKFFKNILYFLIPVFLATIFLVKNVLWSLPLLLVGLIIQILLLQEYRKQGRQKQFIAERIKILAVSLLLIVYLVLRYKFWDVSWFA